MVIEEIKQYFPENWDTQGAAIGYCYITYCPNTDKIYIGKKQSSKFLDSYYGSGVSVKHWKTQKYVLLHWPISWATTGQELMDQEHTWVAKAREIMGENCANVRPGGAPAMLGKKHSPETIQKMRESAKRVVHQPMSQETKDKIAASNVGKHNKTDEERKAVGDFHRGRKRSEETCRRIGESKRGKKNPNFGKPRSEETKKKIRDAQKGRPLTPEHRANLKRSKLKESTKN